MKEQARGSGCPWDDHSAFMRRSASMDCPLLAARAASAEPSRLLRPLTPSEQREAYEQARSGGRRIRDEQTKIGAAAPWDAPERALPLSTYGAASQAVASRGAGGSENGGGEVDHHAQEWADQRREAVVNKARMAGNRNILAGNYLMGEGRAPPVGRSSRPPMPEKLLPQAMLKVQMDGLDSISAGQAACLNARVMFEACRDKSVHARLELG